MKSIIIIPLLAIVLMGCGQTKPPSAAITKINLPNAPLTGPGVYTAQPTSLPRANSPQTPPPSSLLPPLPTPTVHMSLQGAQPSTITVTPDTTITFINSDQEASIWPASNPHPFHTDLPNFDARGPLEPKAAYSFTFKEPGGFGFHDHLHPWIKGTIIVQ